MANGTQVAIRLTKTIGVGERTRVINETYHGTMDPDGTFHTVLPGRGGTELIIPSAQDLIVEPSEPAEIPAEKIHHV